MMTLAKMVGIEVPAIDLVDISSIHNLPEGMNHLGSKAFVIERFDRTDDGHSIHIEDFAQVFGVYPPRINTKEPATAAWSAYDFVSTIAYIPGDKSALAFSRGKEFSDYTVDELEHLSAKTALPRKLVMDTTRETVGLFMQRWANEKNHLPMHKDVRLAIDKHLKALPIVSA